MQRAQSIAPAKLDRVALIDLPTFVEPRGNVTVVESAQGVPFPIVRIFYIYGVPEHAERGAHAHRETEQAFIAVNGNFSVELTDGRKTSRYVLREPNRALYVPPMIWGRLYDFDDEAVCLVLTSAAYDPADYIRQWDEYLAAGG